jgi:hypothetical protein
MDDGRPARECANLQSVEARNSAELLRFNTRPRPVGEDLEMIDVSDLLVRVDADQAIMRDAAISATAEERRWEYGRARFCLRR